jgi:hypothetical protein
MQELNKICLQFACYGVVLVISLGLQASRPDLFAMLCTQLPVGDFLNQASEGLEVPLNSPLVPSTGRVK